MCKENFEEMMNEIVNALSDKGYEPFLQLKVYVSSREDSYITRHNNAREKIHKLDINEIMKYIEMQGW